MTDALEEPTMGMKYKEDWADYVDDEELSLLGSRFSRALRSHDKRRDYGAYRDDDWNHRSRKRIRPEPYRERFI